MNTAAADGFPQALDRRLTEGLNLLHGRLDVIHEDVRENRGDIKELRKELWDGLKEAAADRARLAEKTELAALADSQQQLVGSVNRLLEHAANTDRRFEVMDRRLASLEEGQQQLVGSVNRLVEHAANTDRRFEVMDRRLVALEEGQQQLVGAVNRLVEHAANTDRRFEVVDRRLVALEEGQQQLVGAVNRLVEHAANTDRRLAALEGGQRELIAKISTVLERSEGVVWTRRQVLAGVAAGVTLLVAGALLQPLLERLIAALFAG